MVLYDACIFCMHTVNCRLEHYRELSPARTPPRSRSYTLPPSPASSTGRNISLTEISPASSSDGTVIRNLHPITSPDSPNWRAHDECFSDVEQIAAEHTADSSDDEPNDIMLGSPSSLETRGTPTPPRRTGWLPLVGDGNPASPTPAARNVDYTTLSPNRRIAKMPHRRTLLDVIQECEAEKSRACVDDDKSLSAGLRRSLDAGETPVESLRRIGINEDVYENYRHFADLLTEGAITPENLRRDTDEEEGVGSDAIHELLFGTGSGHRACKGKAKWYEQSYPSPDPDRSPPSECELPRTPRELAMRSFAEDWPLETMLEHPTPYANLWEYARSELEPRKRLWPENWDELMPNTRMINELIASKLEAGETRRNERKVKRGSKEVDRKDIPALLDCPEIDVKDNLAPQPKTGDADDQTILGTGQEVSEPAVVRLPVPEGKVAVFDPERSLLADLEGKLTGGLSTKSGSTIIVETPATTQSTVARTSGRALPTIEIEIIRRSVADGAPTETDQGVGALVVEAKELDLSQEGVVEGADSSSVERQLEESIDASLTQDMNREDDPTTDTAKHNPDMNMEAAVAAAKAETVAQGVAAGFDEAHAWSLLAAIERQLQADLGRRQRPTTVDAVQAAINAVASMIDATVSTNAYMTTPEADQEVWRERSETAEVAVHTRSLAEELASALEKALRTSVLGEIDMHSKEGLRKRSRSTTSDSEAPTPDPFEITPVASPTHSDADMLVADKSFASTPDAVVVTPDTATSSQDGTASSLPEEEESDAPVPDAFEITPDTTGIISDTVVLNPDTTGNISGTSPVIPDGEEIPWANALELAYPTVNRQLVQEGIFTGFEQAHVRWLLASTKMRLKELQTNRQLRGASASKRKTYKLVIYHGKGKGREGI